MILFLVSHNVGSKEYRLGSAVPVPAHVVTLAHGREDAKRDAYAWLGADPNGYTVTPLTKDGDQIRLNLTLSRY